MLTNEVIQAEADKIREFLAKRLFEPAARANCLPVRSATYVSELIPWLYIRYRAAAANTNRYASASACPSIVIANIEVADGAQGMGLAMGVIEQLLQPTPYYGIVEIELVHNERFAGRLLKEGFVQLGERPEHCLNYYMPTAAPNAL